ncbi:diketogulonate reductase-like aldo/keto reductase [Staphylococcus cohnii]
MDIFDFYLDSNDIEKINALTRTDGRRKDQDPATYEEF